MEKLKKPLSDINFILDPGKNIPKKIAKKLKKFKNLFLTLFSAKTGSDRSRKRKKNFTSEFHSNSTRARKFRKNCKKIVKIKKPLSDIIFNQNGTRQAGKKRKKFYSRIPFVHDPSQKIPKKMTKNFKKIKNLFPNLFLA